MRLPPTFTSGGPFLPDRWTANVRVPRAGQPLPQLASLDTNPYSRCPARIPFFDILTAPEESRRNRHQTLRHSIESVYHGAHGRIVRSKSPPRASTEPNRSLPASRPPL